MERLRQLLRSIDGKGYKAYKQLEGQYQFPSFLLSIDHVQGDPFAAASRISIRMPMEAAGHPAGLWSTCVRRIAYEDYLGRALAAAIRQHVRGHRGTGQSGEIAISTSGQQVLQRNAVSLEPESVEARLTLGLPAAGRTILGRDAEAMFFEELPAVAEHGLCYENLPADEVRRHVESVEDQDVLRCWLSKAGLVAFVADDALLPRRSGIDDHPLGTAAQRFMAPPSLRRRVTLPNGGDIQGMGIPRGVTLVVGGGFHGKSTLLHALERGVYNHMPGDGRERVVTDPTAVKIRAEDGRSIAKVNISPFINQLPLGRDTVEFSTENASGSTSQAANIIEALECGAQLLLIDEDTSATNFMIRDERMQALVTHDKEPITPFLHRVRELYESKGVSSVIVMGGSGDYFDVADTVIMMDTYRPADVTSRARELAHPGFAAGALNRGRMPPFQTRTARRPGQRLLDPARGPRQVKIEARDTRTLIYGRHCVDLSAVEQLVDIAQTRTIGLMIYYYAQHHAADTDDMIGGLKRLLEDADQSGLDIFSPYKVGDLAMPRLHELAACVNRIRDGDWQ